MKKISSITLIIMLNALIMISFKANAESAVEHVAACNAALDKRDLLLAISRAESALKAQPNHRDGLLCKGRALGAQGQYQAALTQLSLAEKNSAQGLEQIIAHILIANLHKNNNQTANAIASYETSLSLSHADKNDKFARINHNFIGDMHLQNKDLNAALSSYLAASKLSMNDNERAESYEYLAATYRALAQYDLAIEYQLKATLTQQKAGTLDAYANASDVLGQTYLLADDLDGAEKTFSKLLKFSKENGGSYYEAKAGFGLAKVKAAKGEKGQAKAGFAEALKLAKSLGENSLAAEIDAAQQKL